MTDLKKLQRDLEFTAEEKRRSSGSKVIGRTPSKARRGAIIALAGVVIAATASWFYRHQSPVLTNRDTILLADFENSTGDEVFDVTLKQGLALR